MQTFYPVINNQVMPMQFVRTWKAVLPDHQSLHIGLLLNGAYAQVPTGFPILDRGEMMACIGDPEQQQKALDWFDHRGQTTQQVKVRKVYPDPEDETWRFIDSGQVVQKQEDLVASLKGTALQAAMVWFHSYHGAHQQQRLDTNATAPQMVEDQVLELLAQDHGQSTEALAKQLGIQPRQMLSLVNSMEQRDMITRSGKLWYLPVFEELDRTMET